MNDMQVPQFLPGEKPPKKPLKIRWQIALGFGVFILIIAVLLWVFQIAFLGAFYRTIKTSEVKNTAELIERILEDSGLDTQVRNLSNERSINIVVTDEMGTQYSAWKHSQRDCLLETMTRNDLRVLFNEVNLEGGTRLSVYSSPFAYEDGVRPDVILYVDIVRTQSGFNRMLLIESEITPVDATVETLQVQLVCVTVIMVLLGGILALFIARRISRPVAAVNEAAKELARGNYNIRFA